ncbi:ubiquitin-conjugating enzyme E2 R1, partial [Equus quagga]|uniref:ubiquitin-conjugating enzyme E2 R1 n=1 Tax=Equus quagga TaxID=89248 RepID=UPI001EE325C5
TEAREPKCALGAHGSQGLRPAAGSPDSGWRPLSPQTPKSQGGLLWPGPQACRGVGGQQGPSSTPTRPDGVSIPGHRPVCVFAGGVPERCTVLGNQAILAEPLIPTQARLKFPIDYPYSPPAFRFLTKMWHPNIYETGDVCISILHPPVDDPQSGELPSERWNPTQNVRTILLSVISLLNEPNTFSPANVDASVMYRKWKESKGRDREYTDIIRKQVLGTKVDAERDGVKVPTTLAEYCVQTKAPAPDEGSDLFYDDYYEDAEAEAEADSCFGDEDDSGTEES